VTRFTDELRILARLAGPIIVGSVATFGMGFADTLLVGPLGTEALAGVSLSTNWYFACSVLGYGALRAVDPIVSQAHGAGDHEAVGRALGNALALALALVVPIWVLLACTGIVLPFFGQDPALVPFAMKFCGILALGVPGSFLFGALRQVLQGIGVVRQATWVLGGAMGVLVYTELWVGFTAITALLIPGLAQTVASYRGASLIPGLGGNRPVVAEPEGLAVAGR
jgi:Na+-driven multidrug efflux pump